MVAQIYTWRTEHRLGIPEITDRLNADHGTYPPPDAATGWTASGVASILGNPKYTGHMVLGRRRTHAGKRGQPVPPRPMAVDAGTGAPGHRHPRCLGHRPADRG